MPPSASLLLGALRDPASSLAFNLHDWDLCLRQARRASLISRLAALMEQLNLLPQAPEKVRPHLQAASAVGKEHERILRWEVSRIGLALREIGSPLILLKGAAYLLAELPPARGRLYSDIDILVPREKLDAVEKALLDHGWEATNLDRYDQHYYRTWMHEIPPLRHRERRTVIDVHHTILPRTGRLHPDPRELFQAAQPLARSDWKVLSPVDMVLHSSAHLFQDGDLRGGLRDLIDLDDLLREFGQEKEFWRNLIPRAKRMDTLRPLFYALRYASEILDTPIPQEVLRDSLDEKPPWPFLPLMDNLARKALIPELNESPGASSALAAWLLYVRSQWLRMPFFLLVPHLLRKGFRRLKEPNAGGNRQKRTEADR